MAPTPARHLATRCAAHATVATSRLLARHGAALAPAPMAAQPWRWRCAAPLVHCGSLTGAGVKKNLRPPGVLEQIGTKKMKEKILKNMENAEKQYKCKKNNRKSI